MKMNNYEKKKEFLKKCWVYMTGSEEGFEEINNQPLTEERFKKGELELKKIFDNKNDETTYITEPEIDSFEKTEPKDD